MILVFIIVFCALIALGFGAASAWSDVKRLTIPNMYVALIAVAFVPAFIVAKFFAGDASIFNSALNHFGAAALMFAVTYALFTLKLVGGGDSKMISAYALWAGLSGLMPLLFTMAVVGGLLGVSTLLLKKYKPFEKPTKDSWISKAQGGAQDVPYGVAIFSGALFAFWQIGYINPSVLISLISG